MKVLVTGVAGFIASRTASMLHAQGHHVVGLDNLNDYYDVRLKVYRLQSLAKQCAGSAELVAQLSPIYSTAIRYSGPSFFECDRFAFHQIDIEDKSALKRLFGTHAFDAVLNLAARAGVRYSMTHPEVYMTTNLMGTLNLLDAMRDAGCNKMVLASTSSLYAGQPMPFHEDLPVNTPISPYAASKKAAEMLVYSYHYLYGMDITVCRYFTVFGPAGRPDMSVFRFIKWIDEEQPIELFGDGTQTRDFTYVDDIARGTIAAMQPLGFEVINLGGGNRPISINHVIQVIEKALGKNARIEYKPFHKADIMETSADIAKAKTLLNWSPVFAPEQGLHATIGWYQDNDDWLKAIKL